MIKTKCLLGENKFIFCPSFLNKTDLIVASVISDNKFNSELIFYSESSENLYKYIDEILENGYDNTISNLFFENNVAKISLEFSKDSIGKVYQIKDEKKDIKISKEIEDEIFIIIKLYLFNLDLKKNVSNSMDHAGSDNYEKYISNEKCYLINKEWILEYRKYYLYDELYNYLENEETKKKLKINLKNSKSYTEINVQKIYDEIKQNANFFKKYYNKEIKIIDESLIKINEVNLGRINNKEIKYNNEFIIISQDLCHLLIINKYKKTIPENEFIINMGKIIIFFNNHSMHQILIGSLNIMNNEGNILPLAFINFINNYDLKNHYEKLKQIDFQTFIKQIKNDNNKLYDEYQNEIGELYYLDENNNEIYINKNQNKILKSLIDIYFSLNKLNSLLNNKPKEFPKQENNKYFLINKETMNFLIKCYHYDEIIKVISENNYNKNLREMINDSIPINNIIYKIPEKIKNDINNGEKIYNMNLFQSFEKNIKIENNEVDYYDDFILINEKIKNNLYNLNEIKDNLNIEANCFIDFNNRIFLLYELKNRYIISIGKINENIFETNCIIYFIEKKYYEYYLKQITIKNEIPAFIDRLKQEKNYLKFLKSKNNCIGYIFLLDNIKNKNNFQNKQFGINILKLLIILFLHYEELNEDINKEIKPITYKSYFLINKEFMRKYKEYYNFKEIKYKLKNNEKIKTIFLRNKSQIIYCIKNKIKYDTLITDIIKEFNDEFIIDLGKKRENQDYIKNNLANDNTITILKKRNIFKYYFDTEMINFEFINLFNKVETQEIINLLNKLEINCFLGEEKIFINVQDIKNKYYYLDICQLQNNILINNIIIYYNKKSNFDTFIYKIQEETFEKIINPHLNELKEKNISFIYDNELKIIGKIMNIEGIPEKKNNIIVAKSQRELNSTKFLKLILYLNKFINNSKNVLQSGYLIKYDFLDKIKNFKSYQLLSNYITNNENIQIILKDNKDDDLNLLLLKVLNKLDENLINNINSENNDINIFMICYNVEFSKIKLNTDNDILVANNFIILNDELYKLFNDNQINKEIEKFKYYNEKNRLFLIIDNNTIEVCNIDNNINNIKPELFLNYFNQKIMDENFNQLRMFGFNNYLSNLLNKDDIVSPIFDINQHHIGNAYKYLYTINDYTQYNINLEIIRNIFLLYLNNKKLSKMLSDSKNEFYMFYIINKNWIQEYEKHYNFDSISKSLDKNEPIQIMLNDIIANIETNINVNDKLIALLAKKLDKEIIDFLNCKDKEFKLFVDINICPNLSSININEKKYNFFDNLELISSEVYEILFKEINKNINLHINEEISFKELPKNKGQKVECLFDDDYIIIKFNDSNSEGKYVVEIWMISLKKSFNLEYLIYYNTQYYMNKHIENIVSNRGFKKFCENLKNCSDNIINLKGKDNALYGIAIRINKNNSILDEISNNTINTNKVITSLRNLYNFTPKIGLADIGEICYMNSTLQCFSHIEELVIYFKFNNYVNEVINKYKLKKELCLTASFKIIIEKLWPNENIGKLNLNKHFSPNDFQKKLAQMNPLFQSIASNEPKDLILFIIDVLHNELNQGLIDNNFDTINNNIINIYNEEFMFINFLKEYKKNFRSKISELFCGFMKNKSHCLNCNIIRYDFQIYYFLQFSLEEVRKYIINQINNFIDDKNNLNDMKNFNNNF